MLVESRLLVSVPEAPQAVRSRGVAYSFDQEEHD